MNGIYMLEAASEQYGIEIDVDEMLKEYRKLYPIPIWRLIEDIEQQAMLYANIVDQIKSGEQASVISGRYRELELVPGASLPNPNVPALLQKAFGKIAAYRRALVEIVKKYGGELLDELAVELERTVSVGVDLGLPPSVSIAVEFSAKTTTVTRFSPSP